MPKSMRVALTGSAGSGKSTVCRCLREKGLVVIDLDSLSREVVAPGSPSLAVIRAEFGPESITSDGGLNRSYLRRLIIADRNKKKKLEDILHPRILAGMNQQIDDAFNTGEDIVIVEVPLLFESGMEKMFDFVVVIICDQGDRIKRLSLRDGVSTEEASALISIQMPDDVKAEKADYLISNSGGVAELSDESEKLYNYLKSLRLDN